MLFLDLKATLMWPLVALLLPLLWLIRNRFYKGLNRIPGPVLNSISVFPRLKSVFYGASHQDELSLHRKYGSFVRTAPHIVSVADPAAFDTIYGISSKLFKSGFYEPVRFHDDQGIIPDPFVLADKAMHARMKRNAANAYSLQSLVRLEPMVDLVGERLIAKFDAVAEKGQALDIGQRMLFFAMDTIFTVTFGRDLNFIKNGDESGMVKQMQDGLVYMVTIGQIPWAHKFLLGSPWVEKILGYLGGGPSLMDEVMSLAITQRATVEKEIADTDDDESKPATFLVQLLRNQIKNPSSITDREINAHTFGNIIAGGDTTATALRAIIRELVQHPEVVKRVREELKDASVTETVGVVPYAVASKLPYLTAVIKESMRLHPSVGMILAREVPAGGTILRASDGREYSIGAGAEVGINPWILHRDSSVFPNPETFAPERWLKTTGEALARMNKFWIPFGAGRHTCSGQHISMLEIYKLVPTLVARYDMHWEEGIKDVSVVNHFFMLQSGLRVLLKKR